MDEAAVRRLASAAAATGRATTDRPIARMDTATADQAAAFTTHGQASASRSDPVAVATDRMDTVDHAMARRSVPTTVIKP